jgi:hypothetical protein
VICPQRSQHLPCGLGIVKGQRRGSIRPKSIRQRAQFVAGIGAKILPLIDGESYASQDDRQDTGRQDQQSKFAPNWKVFEVHGMTFPAFSYDGLGQDQQP